MHENRMHKKYIYLWYIAYIIVYKYIEHCVVSMLCGVCKSLDKYTKKQAIVFLQVTALLCACCMFYTFLCSKQIAHNIKNAQIAYYLFLHQSSLKSSAPLYLLNLCVFSKQPCHHPIIVQSIFFSTQTTHSFSFVELKEILLPCRWWWWWLVGSIVPQ